MKTRKLVLIIADIVLLAVCIVQGVLALRETTKYFELKDGVIDEILIDTPEEKGITVIKENGQWYVGKQKYEANQSTVDSFISAMSSIRVLDKVGSTGNEAVLERYELNDLKKTTVTAKGGGKVLRTIEIGKKAMSDTQAYITVDGGKDIYLATGNLPYIFDTITSAIRTEIVMQLEPADITSVTTIKPDGETWTLSRMGNGEDVAWNITDAAGTAETFEIDSEAASTWFSVVSFLNTKKWYEDYEKPEGTLALTLKIEHAFQTAVLEFYALPEDDQSQQEYYGKYSGSPYLFQVHKSTFDKFVKETGDFAK